MLIPVRILKPLAIAASFLILGACHHPSNRVLPDQNQEMANADEIAADDDENTSNIDIEDVPSDNLKIPENAALDSESNHSSLAAGHSAKSKKK
ncbi:uncharacterized protein ZMO1_ZMO1752 [Zymomonas mobilis subsp. mobilis ZM4 = ATCC 31821]|uniref:Lipoprotein n=2 Tax=Zymomonas mobilis subsp. mobilis TaxID=120045 RepID=Q5NLN4_ZYMMO|nr:hypothetical protein [Zymomonas mobilis]AAV90376.1 hypothetical protein ZMO1752 [Zymomonas mobilis subsp. mobilis ZM4 = ATCC 31821]AEH63212.1 conserved hypothetical protein [Zymomonas mobilis subsp. mobilis ATCC 10988]AHB10697.1 hypothetical protein ZCP4_1416 [Zymomonas mobilis subsp. mobilis str. CP4 = NRRL B-14023]AHJ71009.1 hypothetical protein A254_01414 [Zymomonas mobilis subsp. mobilis NRRL B-12526]AHJ72862.1 hypothetical protein A265_01415 [Zymomonas mobilis subsp. mobilis str. CP4 =